MLAGGRTPSWYDRHNVCYRILFCIIVTDIQKDWMLIGSQGGINDLKTISLQRHPLTSATRSRVGNIPTHLEGLGDQLITD